MTKVKFFCIGCLIAMVFILSGCVWQNSTSREKFSSAAGVRYQVGLQRQTLVELKQADSQSSAWQKMYENLDLVMVCQPLEKKDDGSMSFEIAFDSIQAKRTDFLQTSRFTDSVTGLSGKSFTVTVTPWGMVICPLLEQELKNLSANSFEEVKRPGTRLKRADFLADVWAIQTLLFEAIAASENTAKDTLQTTRQLPFPIADIHAPTADITWQKEKTSSGISLNGKELLTDKSARNMIPPIYPGQYKMEGLLGYLRHCKYESVEGEITCRFKKNKLLPQEIQLERTIKASADYILTQSNPQCEITTHETLKAVLAK